MVLTTRRTSSSGAPWRMTISMRVGCRESQVSGRESYRWMKDAGIVPCQQHVADRPGPVPRLPMPDPSGVLLLTQPDADDGGDAWLLHRNAVDGIGGLHGSRIMSDNQEL